MQFFIQITFIVTVFISGYQCGCLGNEGVEEFFDISTFFHPVQNYAIRPHNLESIFTGFNASIENITKLLNDVKNEENASQLLQIIGSNLHEFSIWLWNIRDLQNTIVVDFVNDTINDDKKFIKDNIKLFRKLRMDQIAQLGKILQDHASVLIKHHNEINQNIGLLAREMVYRKINVDMIAEHIAANGTTPKSLKTILDIVKPKLFQATSNMIEINRSVSQCIIDKNEFKPTKQLEDFLSAALATLPKTGKNLIVGSVSVKKRN